MNIVKTVDGQILIINTDSIDAGERLDGQKRIAELIADGLADKKKNTD